MLVLNGIDTKEGIGDKLAVKDNKVQIFNLLRYLYVFSVSKVTCLPWLSSYVTNEHNFLSVVHNVTVVTLIIKLFQN